MSFLRNVDIWTDGCGKQEDHEVISEWFPSLVSNNASLISVRMHGFPVTDADLEIASRLHLHVVSFSEFPTNKFTVDGLLTFLRGSSRKTISEFSILADEEVIDRLKEEFLVINHERDERDERFEVETRQQDSMVFARFWPGD